MILIFDCESNGKIINYSLPCEVVDNYPRLSQLSYKIFDKYFKLVKTVNEFILPDGWDFPDEPFFKENADINKNKELGKPVKDVLYEFIKDRLEAKYIVAHNINFDVKVIRAEMIRLGYTVEFTAKKKCTMMLSTSHCRIPHLNGKKGIKWPSLTELHNFLFGCDFNEAHDAMGDVNACTKCFFELIQRKVILLD